jgi:hypothetical protein
MLAVAAFTVNLYEDVGGVPGEPVTQDTVQVGDTFFVEIMARELDPVLAGLGAVAIDIAWDPNVLEEADAPFDPSTLVTSDLPLFQGGALNNRTGTIEDLRGAAFLSSHSGRAIGNLFPERFALLHFKALQAAEASTLSMNQGRSRIVTVPVSSLWGDDLRFESQTITVVEAPESTDTTGGGAPPADPPGGSAGSVVEQWIDVANPGRSPITIQELQVSAPNIAVDVPLTGDAGDDLVIAPGQTQRLQFTYTPGSTQGGSPWVDIAILGLANSSEFATQYRLARSGAHPAMLTPFPFAGSGSEASAEVPDTPLRSPLSNLSGLSQPAVGAAVDAVFAADDATGSRDVLASTELEGVAAVIAYATSKAPVVWDTNQKDGADPSEILPTPRAA